VKEMRIFDYINNIKYNVVSKKIFRHEVEAAIFGNKKYRLPGVNKITAKNIEEFKKNYPFNFYSDKNSLEKAVSALKAAEDEAAIIASAEKILSNTYDIIGSGDIVFGDTINWHYDYRTQYKWHEVLVWRDNFLHFPDDADIKYPWELARFHQGIILGKAYLLTGNNIYFDKFVSLFNDFRKSNPFCIGVNWVSPDEVSIRLVNIFFAFAIFVNSEKADEELLNNFCEFVLEHAVYIENNLNYSTNRGHEYLSNLLALAITGLLFKEHPYGNKNIEFAYAGFEQEIRKQVHKDGVSFEQSVPFHSFTLENFYLGKIILEKAGVVFTNEFNNRLHNMFLVQNSYIRDDMSVPQIGDSVSNRLITFNEKSTEDSAYTLAPGKYLFKDTAIKKLSRGTAELVLLFGPDSVEEYNKSKADSDIYQSVSFPEGGHYILRDSNLNLFIEAGEIGKHGEGAPGHNDIFTFDLFYKNRNIIVDPGCFSYYQKPDLRNFLRSVKAHNTFFIDNIQIAEFEGLFKVKEDITKPRVILWQSDNKEDILSAQHFAYTKLSDPVISKRTFNFNKDEKIINIKDELLGGMSHEVTFNLNFHPGVKLTETGGKVFTAQYDEALIEISFICSCDILSVSIQDAQYSPSYGVLKDSRKLTIVIKSQFPVSFETCIKLL
jgi:hypothetical protein